MFFFIVLWVAMDDQILEFGSVLGSRVWESDEEEPKRNRLYSSFKNTNLNITQLNEENQKRDIE